MTGPRAARGLGGCSSWCFSFSDGPENSEQKLHRALGMGEDSVTCAADRLDGPSSAPPPKAVVTYLHDLNNCSI